MRTLLQSIRDRMRGRKPESPGRFPYTRTITLDTGAFLFWVADAEAATWYDHPDSHLQTLAEIRGLSALVRPGDRVLEIGSHHGFFTSLLALRTGAGGAVTGVEALPRNCLIAQANCALNGFTHARVRCAVAAETPGTRTLSGAFNARVTAGAAGATPFPAVTGDDLDAAGGQFTVLKLDVEGYEWHVLRGCRELLRRRPRLAIEIHNTADMLRAHGGSVQALAEVIDFSAYTGELHICGGDEVLLPFEPEAIPRNGMCHIFLRPKL